MISLAVLEEVIDASGVAPRIEAMLPAGVRRGQLSVRALLAGICLTHADHRPAHLTRVHRALISLPEDDRWRLGVLADWKHGPHLLTYRQTERTFGLVTDALAEDEPGGLPSAQLRRTCDDLLEASVPAQFKNASSSLAAVGHDQRPRRQKTSAAPPRACPPQPGAAAARPAPRSPPPARPEPAATPPQAPPPQHPGPATRRQHAQPAQDQHEKPQPQDTAAASIRTGMSDPHATLSTRPKREHGPH